MTVAVSCGEKAEVGLKINTREPKCLYSRALFMDGQLSHDKDVHLVNSN